MLFASGLSYTAINYEHTHQANIQQQGSGGAPRSRGGRRCTGQTSPPHCALKRGDPSSSSVRTTPPQRISRAICAVCSARSAARSSCATTRSTPRKPPPARRSRAGSPRSTGSQRGAARSSPRPSPVLSSARYRARRSCAPRSPSKTAEAAPSRTLKTRSSAAGTAAAIRWRGRGSSPDAAAYSTFSPLRRESRCA